MQMKVLHDADVLQEIREFPARILSCVVCRRSGARNEPRLAVPSCHGEVMVAKHPNLN